MMSCQVVSHLIEIQMMQTERQGHSLLDTGQGSSLHTRSGPLDTEHTLCLTINVDILSSSQIVALLQSEYLKYWLCDHENVTNR